MEKNKNILKFAFLGTPDVASRTLEILKSHGYLPKIIITSPDQKSGRGMQMAESNVSAWAKTNNIACLKPEKIDFQFIEEFKKYEVDLSIVVAYGKILPEALIKVPRLGTINIHYSLLPKYRGASPVEQALLNGDTKTGIAIQEMAFKLDTGDIIATEEVSIALDDTKESLRTKLINVGGKLLADILPDIGDKKVQPKPQDESEATYTTKIKKEDGQIDPNGDPIGNYNKYRAFNGWPGVFFFKDGKRIKITKARFENGQFIIEKIIPEGKSERDFTASDSLK